MSTPTSPVVPLEPGVGRDLMVVGASAGGVEALQGLVRLLPADLPAAVFVVLHTTSENPSALPSILSRAGPLPAVHARDGDAVRHGRILVAPPDHHLLLDRGSVRVIIGPRENRNRPAVDPLFRSAAYAYGPRVIGVVLSGMLDDGTAGLRAIKTRGGVAVVQDPKEALFAGMPRSAIENVDVDHCLPIAAIAPLLARLSREPVPDEGSRLGTDLETRTLLETPNVKTMATLGTPSGLSCPDCSGPLWDMEHSDFPRFRCHVGHAFSAESLVASQSEAVEFSLWAALRALDEKAELARRLASRARTRNQEKLAKRLEEDAAAMREQVGLLRDMVSRTKRPVSA